MRTVSGVVLKYNYECEPKFRVFGSMDALVTFVGAFTLKYGQRSDFWVDAVFNGEVTLVDESLEFEYDESFNSSAKPKDGVQRKSRTSKNPKRNSAEKLDG